MLLPCHVSPIPKLPQYLPGTNLDHILVFASFPSVWRAPLQNPSGDCSWRLCRGIHGTFIFDRWVSDKWISRAWFYAKYWLYPFGYVPYHRAVAIFESQRLWCVLHPGHFFLCWLTEDVPLLTVPSKTESQVLPTCTYTTQDQLCVKNQLPLRNKPHKICQQETYTYLAFTGPCIVILFL